MGQGPSRNNLQDGQSAVDRRPVRGETSNARQKDLSDRALRILEELSALGRQGSGHAREGPQRPRRQVSETPFHASGRLNPSTATHSADRADRADYPNRPRQGMQAADARSSAAVSRPRTADRQRGPVVAADRHMDRQPSSVRFEGQGSSSDARVDHRPSSRQHSRQKPRPVSAARPSRPVP